MRLIFLFTLMTFQLYAQQSVVEGVVKDTEGHVLSFVTVSLKHSKNATITNTDGYFKLSKLPLGEQTLLFSAVGFQSIEQKVLVGNSPKKLDVQLTSSTKELNEVVVKATAQTKVQETKALSIKSIEIKDVINQTVLLTDVLDKISGVRIRRSSSLGEASDISINGLRGNAIRVYIDGIPMEFMYPSFDISNLPLGNIKRVDVYKGVLPVDVGSDALGGGINIITEQKAYNTLKASYNIASFNTHLSDVNLGLANKNNYFLNASLGYNYSDNSYKMRALVYETNKYEQVKRFHDTYRFLYGSLTLGTHSKAWADEFRVSLNLSGGDKEMQNGARITNTAIGEAKYTAKNLSAVLKYEKSFLNEKIWLRTLGNFTKQSLRFVDTTTNVYSWSGSIVGKNQAGEYSLGNSINYNEGITNRTSIEYRINEKHKLLLSNLYAKQKLTGTDYLNENGEIDYLTIPQYLTKNIGGLQYEGLFGEKITLSGAVKKYDYILDGAENNTFLLVKKKGNFWGWNAGLKYNFNENTFLRASFEKGFLIPLFYQFVGNGGDILRNTDLSPESSDNLNIGLSSNHQIGENIRLSTSLSGFYRQQYNIIYLGSSVFRRYENADQVRTLGGEGDISLWYKKAINLKANLTLLSKTFTAVLDSRNSYLIGTAFPNYPTTFGNVELSWQKSNFLNQKNQIRFYTFYNYIGAFNHILVAANNSPSTTPDAYVPVQHRVDLGCSYKLSKQNLTLSFNIQNLLNAELYDNFLVPKAGINFNGKIIYEINNF
ncbi:TonB-dependent receptor [Arcicella rosea]|uniref:Outer membrane receptor protein involved in Fe transport n=1 Tax=Arcicella rosea TaxID=502909 RepID=A0A841EHW0_9BACT|nr:TonB-dependent receptor [Arcicella rosea]MBB6003787.1 outer membrane receptor protein involved in Fe transport [Arcicella rosea]